MIRQQVKISNVIISNNEHPSFYKIDRYCLHFIPCIIMAMPESFQIIIEHFF